MAVVELGDAEPMRHLDLVRQIVELHGVLVATQDPLSNAHVVVELESIEAADPHDASRMVCPTLDRLTTLQLERRIDKLHGFDTLLTKTTVVEALGGLNERVVWQEGLHGCKVSTRQLHARVKAEKLLFFFVEDVCTKVLFGGIKSKFMETWV